MCNGWCYQLEMSKGSFKYVWHTRTHVSLRSTGEDGEGENERISRKGERITNGETWRMTLKTQKRLEQRGEIVDYPRHII